MKLYHGTNIEIDTIDLQQCKPFKDFGKGFYLTELKEQAVKMAHRVSTRPNHKYKKLWRQGVS